MPAMPKGSTFTSLRPIMDTVCSLCLILLKLTEQDSGLIDEHTEVQDFLALYWFDLPAHYGAEKIRL